MAKNANLDPWDIYLPPLEDLFQTPELEGLHTLQNVDFADTAGYPNLEFVLDDSLLPIGMVESQTESMSHGVPPISYHGVTRSGEGKSFPCTYCEKISKNIYEWKRHEVTHGPKMWICMPDWSAVVNDRCVFCGQANPPAAHLDTHEIEPCLAMPIKERAYSRKDQLRNHVRAKHLKEYPTPAQWNDGASRLMSVNNEILNNWRRDTATETLDPANLRCKICEAELGSWQERVNHVGEHLRIMQKQQEGVGLRM